MRIAASVAVLFLPKTNSDEHPLMCPASARRARNPVCTRGMELWCDYKRLHVRSYKEKDNVVNGNLKEEIRNTIVAQSPYLREKGKIANSIAHRVCRTGLWPQSFEIYRCSSLRASPSPGSKIDGHR